MHSTSWLASTSQKTSLKRYSRRSDSQLWTIAMTKLRWSFASLGRAVWCFATISARRCRVSCAKTVSDLSYSRKLQKCAEEPTFYQESRWCTNFRSLKMESINMLLTRRRSKMILTRHSFSTKKPTGLVPTGLFHHLQRLWRSNSNWMSLNFIICRTYTSLTSQIHRVAT